MPEDIIKIVALFIVLLIAFPTIGAVLLESVLTGIIIGLFIAIIIGIVYFFWNLS